MYLGVDTGGTFTDFVFVDPKTPGQASASMSIQTHKVLSTPEAPERAILQGIQEMGLAASVAAGRVRIIHGSTVATNAALEGKGVRTAFITNRGFKDMLSIGRQARAQLFALEMPPPVAPVPEELCLECDSRVSAHGLLEEQDTAAGLGALAEELEQLAPEAVAINLLFSFLDPGAESRIADYLAERLSRPAFISCSSTVLPEYREYERGIATWLNASLGPLVQDYLLNLQAEIRPSPLSVMQSNGGTIAAGQAAGKAVNLLLSGPAGGLAAARFLGQVLDESRLMTFDMGGTSTDVALMDGDFSLTTEGRIGPWPVAVPMVDMHTIGAGGGSIASIDQGNVLQVGPRSAGASPGPACYGRGGELATVTDANLVLGRLPASLQLAGSFQADLQAARDAVGTLAGKAGLSLNETAEGIIRVANEHMARALRAISVQKGHDPGQFRLCCFGGAGGLHICQLAESLGMSRALVPLNPGVLSALGMLLAPAERHLSRTHNMPLDALDPEAFNSIVHALKEEGREQLLQEQHADDSICPEVSVDLRYLGQSACLSIPWENPRQAARDFHALHAHRYGHALHTGLELVTIRVVVRAPRALQALATLADRSPGVPVTGVPVAGYTKTVPVYERLDLAPHQQFAGPALITETTATTFIDMGWQLRVDAWGNLRLDRID